MTEPVEFHPEAISVDRRVTDSYYVFYRNPPQKGELCLRMVSTEEMVNIIADVVNRLGCPRPKDAFESFPLLIREGVMVNAYANCWGEQWLLVDAWQYGSKAYDRAVALVREECAMRAVRFVRQLYEDPQSEGYAQLHEDYPDEPCFPFLSTMGLDEAASRTLDDLNEELKKVYTNQGFELEREVIMYTGVFEDFKMALLRIVEEQMKQGVPLAPTHWIAMQSQETRRLIGRNYTREEIEAYQRQGRGMARTGSQR